MTLLSIIASDAIALPLSPSFPASELRYILNDSEALALLTSTKFKSKAEEVVKEGLDRAPVFDVLEKRVSGGTDAFMPYLEPVEGSKAGMMLYTSGTTSRPVRQPSTFTVTSLLTQNRKASCFRKLP